MEQQHRRTAGGRWRTLTVGTAVGALVVMSAGAGVAASGFTDVPDDHAFSDEIAWMADTGISTGYPDGTFRPNADVTRQAMAAFMQRLAGHDDDVDPIVDAAELGGRPADSYLTKAGWTYTALPPHAFVPGSTADVTYAQGYARFSRDGSVVNAYGHPQLDTQRWGEEQYLHNVEVCFGDSDRPVTGMAARVYRQPAGEAQAEVFSQEISIDSTDADCHRINIDIDQDDSAISKEGFPLSATDYVEVRAYSNNGSGNMRVQGGTITTSQSPTRTDWIVLPPIIVNPPIIINPLDASGIDDPELGK